MSADWLTIKNEYISTNITYQKLAEKYSVGYSLLTKKAVEEKWTIAKKDYSKKVAKKVQQKIEKVAVKKEVDRLSKIMLISDELVKKINIAVGQLDLYNIVVKETCKTTDFKRRGNSKVTIEKIKQIESIDIANGIIDRLGLKRIVSALKDITEVQSSIELSNRGDNKQNTAVDKLIATLGGRAVEGENDD